MVRVVSSSRRFLLTTALAAVAGCGGGDGGGRADGGPHVDARPRYDADPNAGFDHFTIEITPAVPLATRDMTVHVVAYSSADEASVLGYDSTVSITASVGNLSGAVSEQPLERGQADLVVQLDAPADAVIFTITDDGNPNITGTSAPVRVAPPGDQATLRAVVINEVNWYGSGADTADEWIELRNLSGSALQLSEWTIASAAGGGDGAIRIANGTELAANGFLLLAVKQGDDQDGERTSLTGVSADVQLQPIALSNTGEQLVLQDPDGTQIDATPPGAWPAGNNVRDFSMERRDDISGGGYGDGSLASSWYTWSLLDGGDTTSGDTVDRGTPGAANSDPDLFDHFTIELDPNPPRAGVDFTMTVTAYSSSDDSQVITSYDSSVSVTASAGSMSGQDSGQPITDGVASLTLQNGTPNPDVTLTVRDDLYPAITGSVVVEIRPVGDTAGPRDVVVNEVNWYGNGVTGEDEWIELRNTSGAELNVSGWTIEGAATGSAAYTIDNGTLLAAGGYLVIGELQGADVDGQRTSLTGVANVQLGGLALSNNPGGEQLVLRDIDGTLIDQTPPAPWPAGDGGDLLSMERRDNVTGGGYTDGAQPGAWYTWNRADNRDTTHPDSLDHGTPGARNSDPAAFVPPVSLPYASGFENGDPAWENRLTGGFSNTPPGGTSARNGTRVITTDSITTLYSARQIQSVDCIALDNGTDPVDLSIWGTASTANGGNVVRGRLRVLWFTDQSCATAHDTPEGGATTGTILPQGSYLELTASATPPSGGSAPATHFKIRFELVDTNGLPNDGDDWAADDVSATQ